MSRLAAAYRDWLRSRRALAAARQATPDVVGVEVALENALMSQTLRVPGGDTAALFDGITVDQLIEGLSFTGLHGPDARLAARIVHGAVRSTFPLPVVVPEGLTVTLEPRHLVVGAFRLERVTPVDRLLAHARRTLGAQAGREAVAVSALRYASLFARTRHIGPPQVVYDHFHAWGVRNEGFASPFNSRLLDRPGSGFYSAFPDVDAPLGSRGSFFGADPADHPGAWCLDPPFLPDLMRRVDRILRSWRRREPAPSALLIVPMSHTPDAPIDETVVLKAGVHHYTGLDGEHHPLPVDVGIHRLGPLPGFDAEVVKAGYLPGEEVPAPPLQAELPAAAS